MANVAAAYKNLSACSVVLNNIDGIARKASSASGSSNATVVSPKETTLVVEQQSEPSDVDDSDGEMFEIEESEAPHVPLYHLRDEGAVKWALLTDLLMMLKVKSKDTLLKQVNALSIVYCKHLVNILFLFRSAHRVPLAATTIVSCFAN